MLSYPVRLVPQQGGMVLLTFPDVPEAVVLATGEEDAIRRAPAALEMILGGYVLAGRAIPAPSDICGAPTVSTERFSLVGVETV